MDERNFKDRTKKFALQAIAIVESLGRTKTSDVIGKQLLRSATSVGANYRAACRGKSSADVIFKLSIVEEADECLYWMELLVEAGITGAERVAPLRKEADELIAMTVASIKTLRGKTAGRQPEGRA
jgi:four helix bundle protein